MLNASVHINSDNISFKFGRIIRYDDMSLYRKKIYEVLNSKLYSEIVVDMSDVISISSKIAFLGILSMFNAKAPNTSILKLKAPKRNIDSIKLSRPLERFTIV